MPKCKHSGESEISVTLKLQVSMAYYIFCGVSAGGISGRPYFQQIGHEIAERDIMETYLLPAHTQAK